MKDIFNFFEKPKDPLSFSAIRTLWRALRRSILGLTVRKKPETINYRTFKPERGTFRAKILVRLRTTNVCVKI